MGMRICFAEPRPAGHNVYDHVLLPRLGLPLLATLLGEHGHDTAVFCEVLGPIDLGACLNADLVGISGTTATQPAGYALADELTAAGVDVVLGGPHVSFRPDEAIGHAPYVVRGEGQQTMLELVGALETGGPLEGIAGLTWRDRHGKVHHNAARPNCSQEEYERLPIPDLSLIHGHGRLGVKPIMTQWGCPFDCEFCSVTAHFSRMVRYRRNDQVLAELAGLGAREVFFHDDNFVVNKKRTSELLRAMAERDLTPSFSAQMRADTVLRSRKSGEIDHAFLALLRRAGCQMAMIGFESVSEENLAQIRKSSSVAESERAVRAFHEHGIGVHGMFVLGLDGDDADSGEATAEFARRLAIDTLQIMMVTPIPGTRLWDRVSSEGRLIETDWTLYDGHHAVLQPARMTPLELQLTTYRAMQRFYSRSAIAGPALRGVLKHLPGLLAIVARHTGTLAGAVGHELGGMKPGHGGDASAASLLRRVLNRLAPKLTRSERERLQAALWVAAVRLYGRRQIAIQRTQAHTLDHVAHLAALT